MVKGFWTLYESKWGGKNLLWVVSEESLEELRSRGSTISIKKINSKEEYDQAKEEIRCWIKEANRESKVRK